jgi:hypothetical protein
VAALFFYLPELTLPGADATHTDAGDFQQSFR